MTAPKTEPAAEFRIDPALLRSMKNLTLVARQVVEGIISGRHKTPFHGFNLEFAQHRSYLPGDDLRHINWKIYGKSDRLNIKLYEEETDLKAYLLVDSSASMGYASLGNVPKFQYACFLAAALAYVLVRQQDLVGLEVFDRESRKFIPPQSGLGQFGTLVSVLEGMKPGKESIIHQTLHRFQSRLRKRGVVILISDLLESPAMLIKRLKEIRQRQNEVIVFQILDPAEVVFPFQDTCIFRDLETGEEIVVNPMDLRRDYTEKMQELQRRYKEAFFACGIDYACLTTDQDLAINIKSLLLRRARVKK